MLFLFLLFYIQNFLVNGSLIALFVSEMPPFGFFVTERSTEELGILVVGSGVGVDTFSTHCILIYFNLT